VLISVRVVPRSRKNSLEWTEGGLKAHISAPPVDGAANEALLALLAERLDLPRRAIAIVRGARGRQKTVEIKGLTLQEVQQKIS
jgi:uncharacterized protein